ncbi:ABC transporter permease [Lichenibacterium minor]|uniref:ABC transporter permease n=1 Tax=Lichenibacterium minor TaxID=2316528 RepID=A0A4Q2UA96_9HYPH|nr:ABC transporter permease [Lichenibacterium minor]RYC31815.1 ABC transporter permease [Lichenibacterium minor]
MSTDAALPLRRPAPRGRLGAGLRALAGRAAPVLTVVLVLVAAWYAAAVAMNADGQRQAFERAGTADAGWRAFVAGTWAQGHPRLPAPHQVAAEIAHSVLDVSPTSKRSLAFHAAVTLQATALGFLLGAAVGFALSLLVVHVPSLDRGLMPWIVASQAVPIVALAPMIVVILAQVSVTGLLPKAAIAAYLSFFPVAVGMAKGLRSPEPSHVDLLRTYSASRWQALRVLRLPASLPFLFASLKVGVAASLVGTVVAEVTKSEDGGLGARLLAGSYYGQTVQIWAALVVASACGAALVGLVAAVEAAVLRRMGAGR